MNPDIDVLDVTWIDANGSQMTAETWDNELTRCFGMLLDGRAQVSGIKRRGRGRNPVYRFQRPPRRGEVRIATLRRDRWLE